MSERLLNLEQGSTQFRTTSLPQIPATWAHLFLLSSLKKNAAPISFSPGPGIVKYFLNNSSAVTLIKSQVKMYTLGGIKMYNYSFNATQSLSR